MTTLSEDAVGVAAVAYVAAHSTWTLAPFREALDLGETLLSILSLAVATGFILYKWIKDWRKKK